MTLVQPYCMFPDDAAAAAWFVELARWLRNKGGAASIEHDGLPTDPLR